jgi:hypothetical protein
MDAWVRLEEALATSGPPRSQLLHSVLELLGGTPPASDADKAELTAAVNSYLALSGELPLSAAIQAVEEAVSLGRPGWSNYHLAEVAVSLSEHSTAASAIAKIPDGFFQSRDLYWRRIRCLELKAIALIGLGDWVQANRLIDAIAGEYAVHGDSEDLTAPRDLMKALLSHRPDGTAGLNAMRMSLDINEWFDPAFAAEVLS